MKTALITGAARGIGAATARALAADGWRVIVNYSKSRAEARALAAELGGVAVCADVADDAAVKAMIDAAGRIDLLVNNAGVSYYGLLTDMTPEECRELLDVNIGGAVACCRYVLPQMISRKSGSIINVSSIWGLRGASCEVMYSASKAAIIGLTRALAKEVGPSGIRVNCVAPGAIETDMLSGFSVEDKAAIAQGTPLLRLGAPEDPAGLIAFLASDAAGFITGQVICSDGGLAL